MNIKLVYYLPFSISILLPQVMPCFNLSLRQSRTSAKYSRRKGTILTSGISQKVYCSIFVLGQPAFMEKCGEREVLSKYKVNWRNFPTIPKLLVQYKWLDECVVCKTFCVKLKKDGFENYIFFNFMKIDL